MFSLIGDLLTVRSECFHLRTYNNIIQMSEPLGHPSPANLLDVAPATVHCTGHIFVIDASSNSFLVTTWQIIHGSVPLNPLTIRGIMSAYDCKDMPYQDLPKIHSVLSFHGDLLTIKARIVFVAVRNHLYFPTLIENANEEQFRDVFICG